MIKIDREKLKQLPKMCILEENRVCDNCCECFICDLDPTKTCDNCAKCIELADFNSIDIDDILLYDESIFDFSKNKNKKKYIQERKDPDRTGK